MDSTLLLLELLLLNVVISQLPSFFLFKWSCVNIFQILPYNLTFSLCKHQLNYAESLRSKIIGSMDSLGSLDSLNKSRIPLRIHQRTSDKRWDLIKIWGIVPFVATPLQGRFRIFTVVLICYFRLGDCPAGLGSWPRRFRAPRRGKK